MLLLPCENPKRKARHSFTAGKDVIGELVLYAGEAWAPYGAGERLLSGLRRSAARLIARSVFREAVGTPVLNCV